MVISAVSVLSPWTQYEACVHCTLGGVYVKEGRWAGEPGGDSWAHPGGRGGLELPRWAPGWGETGTRPFPGEVILVVANKPLWKM